MTAYLERHWQAMTNPKGAEAPIVRLIEAWTLYEQTHAERYDSPIGDDGVLGEPWAQIGCAILKLLNGETGRLDCGMLDGAIRGAIKAHGFDPDTM